MIGKVMWFLRGWRLVSPMEEEKMAQGVDKITLCAGVWRNGPACPIELEPRVHVCHIYFTADDENGRLNHDHECACGQRW